MSVHRQTMAEVIQVFRKDVRHLAPFILGLLALEAIFAIGTIRSVGLALLEGQMDAMLSFSEGLLPFAWIFLIALAVQQDLPVGENSFWITRPYSRPLLLAAKILFVLVFLNLPLLVSDCFILEMVGLPLDFGHLLLRQLPLTALVAVPAFAFAAISRSVSQFALFLVLLALGIAAEGIATTGSVGRLLFRGITSDTFAVLFFSVCTALLVVFHFAKRSDVTRYGVAVLVVISVPVIFFTTHLLQDETFFFPERPAIKSDNRNWSQVHLKIDDTRSTGRSSIHDDFWTGIRIPVSVDGLPPGVVLEGTGQTRLGALNRALPSSLAQLKDGSYVLNVSYFGRGVGGGNHRSRRRFDRCVDH